MREFKVGDLVRYIANNTMYKVSKIKTWKNEPNYTRVIFADTDDIWISIIDREVEEGFEPWRPKANEWCWFWDYENSVSAVIARFDKIIKIDHTWDIPYTEVLYKSQESGLRRYRNCEPFVGELPNFLKDKQ